MDSSNNNTTPIDLIQFLRRFRKSLLRLWVLILALVVCFACFRYVQSRRNYTPYYECKSIFSVSSGIPFGDSTTNTYFYDSSTAKQLSATFPYLLNTDFMRDLILVQLDKPYINGSITSSVVADTNMVELKVRSTSAEDAYAILRSVLTCYPRAAAYMVDNPHLHMRQEPILPTAPVNTFSGSDALVTGAASGLLLGLLIAFLHCLYNKTVGSSSDLQKLINLPIVASIPLVKVKKRRKFSRNFISSVDSPAIAEALRSLRTRVHKQLDAQGGKIVLLTSTIPGEGKSTCSINLAMSLADEGNRVVLLDGDLRNQTIGRILGTSHKAHGLMECMKNPNLPLMECLRVMPGTNLHYLSGASTRKRHYSIDSKNVRRILDTLCAEFDYVIVDTPPNSVVSDTALLSRHADCVLYVVKVDYAGQGQILDSVTNLHQHGVPLTGCILNGVSARQIRYGYGYGYGYGKADSHR